MTPDEIVKALHKYAKSAQENFEVDTMRDFDSAADLIESLQAQLSKLEKRIAAEGFYDLETMISKYKTVMLAANEISIETDEELEELHAQLAASQHRERAAVKQIEQRMVFDAQRGCEPCEICSNADKTPCEECNPKWRGPQEAGKGDTE